MAFNLDRTRARLSKAQQDEQNRAWIYLSKNWAPEAIGKDWVGRRYLGGGTYGMAALFEYVGKDENVHPRQLVVKQENQPSTNLLQESRMLSRLMRYNSEHIIKIYRAYHRTFGQGTSTSDPRTSDDPATHVSRIYLEYAMNGDMRHHLTQILETMMNNGDRPFLPEEVIWRTWECLVKALLILEKGTEDPDQREGKEAKNHFHHPICHFDIKEGNVLVGGNPKPGHEHINVHKFADFGLALEVPLTVAERRRDDWTHVTEGRNTYHTPEQKHSGHPNRIISPRADIWNVAHIIYRAMYDGREPGSDNITFVVHIQECRRMIRTVGREPLNQTTYSRKLREYVLECLAWDPENRPPASILLQRIQTALRPYENPAAPDNPPEWLNPFGVLIGEDGLYAGAARRDHLNDPPWMIDVDEDNFDHDGIKLLYPSRFDLEHGIREMPFETGRIRRPRTQTLIELLDAFQAHDSGQQAGSTEEDDDNSSLDAQPSQPNQHVIVISSSESDSDGDDDRPDPSPRRVYEARIESIRSRAPRIGRPNTGRWAMKGARGQPASRGNGSGVSKRASRGAQAGRANQPAPPPPERRPGSEIAQDSVFKRAQARNVTSGRGGDSAAIRAQASRMSRKFGGPGDALPDYEAFN